jgi:hypothetical protein
VITSDFTHIVRKVRLSRRTQAIVQAGERLGRGMSAQPIKRSWRPLHTRVDTSGYVAASSWGEGQA